MSELYPCSLPGVRVNSNGYSPQALVRNNEISSGPPRFALQSEQGWLQFSVAWSFSRFECQVFEAWFTGVLTSGAKSALINLQVAGGLLEHECYFLGVPNYTQVGKRWSVSASLLAIKREGLDECDAQSIIAISNGFESPSTAPSDMNTVIETLEQLWVPK